MFINYLAILDFFKIYFDIDENFLVLLIDDAQKQQQLKEYTYQKKQLLQSM
jgi:hypothetical protein